MGWLEIAVHQVAGMDGGESFGQARFDTDGRGGQRAVWLRSLVQGAEQRG